MLKNLKHPDISSIVFNREKFIGPRIFPNHYHPFYELIHINSGCIRFLLKDTLYYLQKGDTLLIAPRELHHAQCYPDSSCDVTSIYFKPSFIPHEVIECFNTAYSGSVSSFIGTVPTVYQNELTHLFNRLQVESNSIDALSS